MHSGIPILNARRRCIYNPYVRIHAVARVHGGPLRLYLQFAYVKVYIDGVRRMYVWTRARARTRTRMYVRAGCRRILVYWSRVVDHPPFPLRSLLRCTLFAPSRPASYPTAPLHPDSTLWAPRRTESSCFPLETSPIPKNLGSTRQPPVFSRVQTAATIYATYHERVFFFCESPHPFVTYAYEKRRLNFCPTLRRGNYPDVC